MTKTRTAAFGLAMMVAAQNLMAQTPAPTEDLKAPPTPEDTVTPAPVAGRELDIQEVIDRSVERSPNVEQSRAERDAQREIKRSRMSFLGPTANVSYTEAHFDKAQTVALGAGDPITIRDDVTKTGSLQVVQPLTGLYAVTQYARLGGIQEDLAEEGLTVSKRDAAFNGALNFLDAYKAQEDVAITESSLLAQQSSYKDAQSQSRVGRLNQADLLKFQLALSEVGSRHALAIASRNIAFARLKQSMQVPLTDTFVLKKQLPDVNQIAAAATGDVDDVIKNRPEIKQAEIQTQVADFNKQVAYAKFIPNVNAFYQKDRNFGEVTGFGAEKDIDYYGIKVQWDIWSNGASIFETRAQGDLQVKAAAALVAAKDAIRLDVIAATENLKAAKEALKQWEDGVAQAEEAYRIDQIRFKSGQISATDLIQSEASRSNALGRRVAARTQYIAAALRAQIATGSELPKL